MKRTYLSPVCTVMPLTTITVLLGSGGRTTINFNTEPIPSGGGGD